MSQSSKCRKCGKTITAHTVNQGRAFYKCSCRNTWTSKAFYGKSDWSTGAMVGGAVAGGLLAGPAGALGGALLSGYLSEQTSKCLRCGGKGRPTGKKKNRVFYQCENCLKEWAERAK